MTRPDPAGLLYGTDAPFQAKVIGAIDRAHTALAYRRSYSIPSAQDGPILYHTIHDFSSSSELFQYIREGVFCQGGQPMAGQEMPMLVVYEGKLEGQRWLVDQDTVTIGRGSDCDIVIPDRQISRYHARIERDDGGYLLYDLDSKNGTYVNGTEVRGEPHRLKDGDEIQIALCIRFGFVGADATLPLAMTGPDRGINIDRAGHKVLIGGQELTSPLAGTISPAGAIARSRSGDRITG